MCFTQLLYSSTAALFSHLAGAAAHASLPPKLKAARRTNMRVEHAHAEGSGQNVSGADRLIENASQHVNMVAMER